MEQKSQASEVKAYDFAIIEIVKAGFVWIEGMKTPFVIAVSLYVGIGLLTQFILGMIFSIGTIEEPNLLNIQIIGILSYPVLMPLLVGIMMMALNYTRGNSIDFKSMFNYYHLTGKLALVAVLMYGMMMLGFKLFIIPGIYLSVAYVFAPLLIVDKQMGVWEAMEHSRKAVTKQWFKVARLMFLLGFISFLGFLALGIGLIWAIPLMFVTLYGLLYPLIFDEDEEEA
ncbi:MAG: hypothetical protein Q9M36_08865 [Sulfurovum sp.]|nr:hypothetical protein [Sulfurovum sp.]